MAIHTHQFPNGLTLLAEPMEWLESAAFTLLLPAGCQLDPLGKQGLANLTCDMVQRGCGSRDSRQFIDDLELLGVDRSAHVGNVHTSYGGALIADRLPSVLEIYADLVRRPHLPPDQLDEAQQVCVQELRALEDNYAQQAMVRLRRNLYPEPYGRHCTGVLAEVEALAAGDVQQFVAAGYRPNGAILGVAGRFEWDALRELVERLFGDWSRGAEPTLVETPRRVPYEHLQQDSSQMHIAVGYESVPYAHPDYYQARGAVGVLSDGMSSRLFDEVREKRGLCYSVYASCHSLKTMGSVLCYAGTTTDRAQETLDVLRAELVRLAKGVQRDELDRLKARIKSGLIMMQESSQSRSHALAVDWYFLGRVQPLDEVSRIIDELTETSINDYLRANPPGDFTVVTVGERPLETSHGVS